MIQRDLFSLGGGDAGAQNRRALAAALVWRDRSCVMACCSSAARSAASTEPWVGRTQAVGQRVMPFVRMNSAITASRSPRRISSCMPAAPPRLPAQPRAGANREVTSAMTIMRREWPSSPPKPRAAATIARPTMPVWIVPWPRRLQTKRATCAEDRAVQQDIRALTRYCGPSAPPVLAIQIRGSSPPWSADGDTSCKLIVISSTLCLVCVQNMS